MLKAEAIRRIELGPRQLTLFESEERTLAIQRQVMERLTLRVQTHGAAEVDAFAQSIEDELDLPSVTVLQHLFWLAHDLQIRFTSGGEAISPSDAYTSLLRSPPVPVEAVLNRSVDANVLRRVSTLFGRVAEDAAGEGPRNEIELARRLSGKLRAWKRHLETWRYLARKPGFPGEAVIDSGLGLIRTVSAKLDAPSLIQAFCEHADALVRLASDVETLSTFYGQDAKRWQMMLQFAQRATETLERSELGGEIAAAHEGFKQILSDPHPYDRLDEAGRLLEILKPCHDRIVSRQTAACRREGLLQVESLIQSMKQELARQGADADMRNRCLYPLRQRLKRIEAAPTMARINRQVCAAEDAYELFRDGL